MNRRKFLATAAATPAAAILGGRFARAEDHLKWAVFTPDSEVTFRTVMKPFAETVQRETNNAVVFDLFPNGALGRNPGQQPQMVIDGVADLAWVIPSYSPGRFPDTEVLELPGMFKDLREASLVASGLAAGKVLKDYGDFYVVGLWGTAPYSIHTNFPVNSIADLKGKTIRASSKNESAALRAFGAVPIGMPVTEIPEAISRGTISGTTSHMSPFFDFGLDRVTNNHFFIGLGVVPLTVVMNRKKFDALPDSARAVIERNAGAALTKVWIESITSYNAANLEKLKTNPKHKVVFPSQADLDEAQKLLAPVRDEWVAASDRHKELKAALDSELAKVRAEQRG
jgi:TRAP-type transport system periplasmic protein